MTDGMFILGIHDGHNCGATLVRDGAVIAAVSEERLTRCKNESGYPRRSIDEVLRIAGIAGGDLAEVAYASNFMHRQDYLTNLETWYCVGIDDQRKAAGQPKGYQKVIFEERKRERIEQARDHLGVGEDKITFTEHHLTHLAAAYYTAPNAQDGRPILGLTCDGAGDGLCATVSVCKGNEIERIAKTDRHASLGKIYSRVTMLMGMKPWEHEYKLMGMAPYADPERVDKAAEALHDLLRLSADGLSFEQVGELSTNFCYEYLRDAFERVRFDTIAGAVQKFTEDMLVDWVRNCIRRTGITDIVAGGGVFMNVKANMLISQIPEVTSYYVMPSGADESCSIGSALHRYYQTTGATDHRASILSDLYLGAEYSKEEERLAIEQGLAGVDIEVRELDDVDAATADLLAANEIVARCRGRMEWGARALGNRSILVSGHDTRVIDRLNRSIKMRDFWMPFAPSMRAEKAARYVLDDKSLAPRFMTFALPTTPEGREHLAAGTHPRDFTARVQMVTPDGNPDYHRLLTLFEERTGRSGFVNTSFNLHGEPIVATPADAVRVLRLSGLKHLALNHFLVSKRGETDL